MPESFKQELNAAVKKISRADDEYAEVVFSQIFLRIKIQEQQIQTELTNEQILQILLFLAETQNGAAVPISIYLRDTQIAKTKEFQDRMRTIHR